MWSPARRSTAHFHLCCKIFYFLCWNINCSKRASFQLQSSCFLLSCVCVRLALWIVRAVDIIIIQLLLLISSSCRSSCHTIRGSFENRSIMWKNVCFNKWRKRFRIKHNTEYFKQKQVTNKNRFRNVSHYVYRFWIVERFVWQWNN